LERWGEELGLRLAASLRVDELRSVEVWCRMDGEVGG
jgi:hypothetical protein